MDKENYIVKSLELHLFFGRIMKEHSFFLKAGFTPANAGFSQKAAYYQREFENLLSQTVALSDRTVSADILRSGEVLTEFTATAENQSEAFTAIPINKSITQRTLRLRSSESECRTASGKYNAVKRLNQRAIKLLDGLIAFKESILKNVMNCKMFTMNYPLLIDHIIREAKLYREYVSKLECDGELSDKSMKDTECFWNRIMMEHALFIRGLLDPTETELFHTADNFAKEFARLQECCLNAHSRTMTADSLEQAVAIREFKRAGTQGITTCKIRSVILPLLADHVLREANHYIRLLKC
ncbi:MAG: DUF2935 domain-containing protein [Ruminococcus sp.]|nr:DUF2935 domain-containing protein [Ruminococcus sp.]